MLNKACRFWIEFFVVAVVKIRKNKLHKMNELFPFLCFKVDSISHTNYKFLYCEKFISNCVLHVSNLGILELTSLSKVIKFADFELVFLLKLKKANFTNELFSLLCFKLDSISHKSYKLHYYKYFTSNYVLYIILHLMFL